MSQLQKVSIQSPSRNTTEDDEAAAQLMARWYTAWCTHDPVAIMACLTEDAVLEEPNGAYRGHHAIVECARGVFRSSADFHLEMLDAWTAPGGNVMATYFKATGTFTGPYDPPGLAPTNDRIEFEGMDRNEIRDGRIARHQIFYDMTGVSRQMGATPAPGTLGERLGIRMQHLAARRLRKRAERRA